ncbi:hypothetical protein N9L31_00235 [bacterium]|nr:hypothetical protein [bacterium]
MTFLTVLELGGAIVLATALGVGMLVELYVCRAVASNGNADEHDDFKIRTEQRVLEDAKKVLAEKEALVAKLIEAHDALRKEKEDVKAMHNHKQPALNQESNPIHEEEKD